jgi:hypothetical protein
MYMALDTLQFYKYAAAASHGREGSLADSFQGHICEAVSLVNRVLCSSVQVPLHSTTLSDTALPIGLSFAV